MKNLEKEAAAAKKSALGAIISQMQYSKLSLRGWAKIIGIGPTALSQILKGERDPRASTFFRIQIAVKKRREEE